MSTSTTLCDICAGPSLQFVDLELTTVMTTEECAHQSVFERCWDCGKSGESGKMSIQSRGRRKGDRRIYVQPDSPGTDAQSIPRSLPPIPPGILEGAPELQQQQPVGSKYLQRLKNRKGRSNSGSSVQAPIQAEAQTSTQTQTQTQTHIFISDENEGFGLAPLPYTPLLFRRCAACTTRFAAMMQGDGRTVVLMTVSDGSGGGCEKEFSNDGVKDVKIEPEDEDEDEMITVQERGKCVPAHRVVYEIKPILKNGDSNLDYRPPEKTISFAETDNLGTPTLPPAAAVSSKPVRRYSSNYMVRIANEKFRKDLALAIFGGG